MFPKSSLSFYNCSCCSQWVQCFLDIYNYTSLVRSVFVTLGVLSPPGKEFCQAFWSQRKISDEASRLHGPNIKVGLLEHGPSRRMISMKLLVLWKYNRQK
jgi:hypothetical protein